MLAIGAASALCAQAIRVCCFAPASPSLLCALPHAPSVACSALRCSADFDSRASPPVRSSRTAPISPDVVHSHTRVQRSGGTSSCGGSSGEGNSRAQPHHSTRGRIRCGHDPRMLRRSRSRLNQQHRD